MRISEKSIELNFCSQFASAVSTRIIWFGLTQKQEARAGFDACTKLRGRLILFQFKASSYVLQTGARRFTAKHDQMNNLIARCGSTRSVFYVFPLIGTTHELKANSNLVTQSRLLDVTRIPSLGVPLTNKGTPRKNRCHYIDVFPTNRAVIHSDPVEVPLIPTITIAESFSERIGMDFRGDFDRFLEFTRLFTRTRSVAGIIT